jgi:HEAT repeat protein
MYKHFRFPLTLFVVFVVVGVPQVLAGVRLLDVSLAQDRQDLPPLQVEIERQRQRLSSAEVEERRDALMRLRSLQHPQASRAALSALNDPLPIIRATAAVSVLWLPPSESVAALVPLLSDKEEFVRQQAAYALGETHSRLAVAALVERLADKKDSVRAAGTVALGQIGDATAVTSLAAILDPQVGFPQSKKSQKSKREKNVFVLRAAVRSLGQIGNRAGVPALLAVLQDEKAEDDVRREVAVSLGLIGDASAVPALRAAAESAHDPYLAEAAQEAIKRISRSQSLGN